MIKEIKRNKKIYELYKKDILTLEEIAKTFGITRERVRQIINREYSDTIDKKE